MTCNHIMSPLPGFTAQIGPGESARSMRSEEIHQVIIMPIEFDDDVAQNPMRHDNLIIATVTAAVFTTHFMKIL